MNRLEEGHHAPQGWRAEDARLTPGDRIAFRWTVAAGRVYITAGTVKSDDGKSVTVTGIADWSPTATLVIPRGDVVRRKRRGSRGPRKGSR